MPELKKLLAKFNHRERALLELLVAQIISLRWMGFEVKKLRGFHDIFRVRKVNFRIIFRRDNDIILLLSIERRNEKTYRKY